MPELCPSVQIEVALCRCIVCLQLYSKLETTTLRHPGKPRNKVGVAGLVFFKGSPGQQLISSLESPDFFELQDFSESRTDKGTAGP
jgi:hypothetical protein